MTAAVGHIGSMVLVVLLDLDLFDLAADLVHRLVGQHGAVQLLVVGLDEEHVLFEDADILEGT